MVNKIDPVVIGQRLRELRADVPRSVVARKLGLSYSALEFYERGVRVPPDNAKILLANYFGKSVQELFFN